MGIDEINAVPLPADDAEAADWIRSWLEVYEDAYVPCEEAPERVPNGLMASLIAAAHGVDPQASYVARQWCFDGLAASPYPGIPELGDLRVMPQAAQLTAAAASCSWPTATSWRRHRSRHSTLGTR